MVALAHIQRGVLARWQRTQDRPTVAVARRPSSDYACDLAAIALIAMIVVGLPVLALVGLVVVLVLSAFGF